VISCDLGEIWAVRLACEIRYLCLPAHTPRRRSRWASVIRAVSNAHGAEKVLQVAVSTEYGVRRKIRAQQGNCARKKKFCAQQGKCAEK